MLCSIGSKKGKKWKSACEDYSISRASTLSARSTDKHACCPRRSKQTSTYKVWIEKSGIAQTKMHNKKHASQEV